MTNSTTHVLPRRTLLRRLAGGGAVVWSSLASRPTHAAIKGPPPLIMLDPGHGGHDPGAIGAGGSLEKDVTLASALAVKAALEASGQFRVALTRGRDRYISLDRRVELARDLDAHLFLSFHADIDPAATVRGAAVYTLASTASDPETEALATRENGPDVSQTAPVPPGWRGCSGFAKPRVPRARSAHLAHQLIRDMEPTLTVLPAPERRANFAVLHASEIPSALIEMGFLSNLDDEAALNDPDHRRLIAESVTRTVETWFTRVGAG